jgi:hypothetical protein
MALLPADRALERQGSEWSITEKKIGRESRDGVLSDLLIYWPIRPRVILKLSQNFPTNHIKFLSVTAKGAIQQGPLSRRISLF